MPAEDVARPSAAEAAHTADTGDGGWTTESYSATSDPTPADTTAERPLESPAEDIATGGGGEEEAGASEARVAGDAASRAVVSPAREGAQPVVAAKKKSPSVQARIDAATFKQREAERREAAAHAELAGLRKRLDEREHPAPPAVAAPAVPDTAAGPQTPTHPKYLDYESDEAFQEAVGQWHADMGAWQRAHDTALTTEFSSTLDARLAEERHRQEEEAETVAAEHRLRAVGEAHPDLGALIEANKETFAAITSPFLQDMIVHAETGADLLWDFATEPDVAVALGDLPLPTRALAHAVRSSSMTRPLVLYFATPEGRDDFLRLRGMPPDRVFREIGKLEARLEAAVRGPVPGVRHSITSAIPPAKPPVGSPRVTATAGATAGGTPFSFDAWMADEDHKERADKYRQLGIAPPA